MTGNRKEKLGIVYIIISAVLFGMMPLLTKIAYQHGSNAYTVAFGRFFLGSVFLFILICFLPGCRAAVTKAQLLELLKLSFFYALMPILLYGSYAYIDSGLATTLHFTYPVVVVLILALFCRAHLSRKQILCTAVSMAGIACLYNPSGQVSTTGILLAVLSGVVYAMYIVLLGKGRVKELHPFVLSFWVALLASLEIGAAGLVTGNLVFRLEWQAWLAEVLLALLATVIALVLFQKGVVLCGEIKASLLSSFEPLTGIAIGMAVFGESLTGKEAVGILCILAAAVVLVAPGRKTGESA